MLKIRPFQPTEAEYEAVVTIENATWPDNPKTVEEYKTSDANREPSYFFQRVVGEQSGLIITVAECGETFWLAELDQYFWHINVWPTYANQRVEEQMYDYLMDLLAQRNPRKFFIGMRDDKVAQVQFIKKRGYQVSRIEPTSHLDVTRFEPSRFLAITTRIQDSGIEIHTLADLQPIDPAWLHKLWELEWAIRQDVPGGQVTRESLAEFEQQVTHPLYDASTQLIAVDQVSNAGQGPGPYIGMTGLKYNKADPTIGQTYLTGVIRSRRRQGIATALKVQAISQAKARGVRRIDTMNHETNPMLDLNRRLGFKPGPAWVYYEKSIGDGIG